MNPLVEELLRKRGVEDFDKFLTPSLDDLVPAGTLPGVTEAVEIILDTIAEGKKIVVFGDYDCDGICATAIVVRVLNALANKPDQIEAFIPRRLNEGYGMSEPSIKRLLKEFPDVSLVITVDNGINTIEEIDELKSYGIKVVVTDHHLPGEELPRADAIVDPKVEAPPELSDICGAAVAFYLAGELVARAKARGVYDGPNLGGPLLVLAGLATITDIMPLLGQNRILVAEALKHFHAWAPVGLKELYLRAARSGGGRLTSRDFGFLLGPRINAAGRLASGMESLELVLSDDREIAREAARIVDLHNTERKAIESKMTEEAMSRVVEGAPAQMIYLPNGHPGVAGIVASRVMEKLGYSVPVCVYTGEHGSARSPDWVNIRDALVYCSSVLTAFGGHAAAGGFSVKPGRINEFRGMLCAYCRQFQAQRNAEEANAAEPDLWVESEDITLQLAEEIERLEPFGEANEEPRFGFRKATFSDVRNLGSDGRHLAMNINGLRAVWWTHGELLEDLRANNVRDVIFNLAISDYGERHVELRLISIG